MVLSRHALKAAALLHCLALQEGFEPPTPDLWPVLVQTELPQTIFKLVHLGRIELPTQDFSGPRSTN